MDVGPFRPSDRDARITHHGFVHQLRERLSELAVPGNGDRPVRGEADPWPEFVRQAVPQVRDVLHRDRGHAGAADENGHDVGLAGDLAE